MESSKSDNFTSLENLKMDETKSIKVDRTGTGLGMSGAGGLIEIELKKKEFDPGTATPAHKAFSGFSRGKDFFIPPSLLTNQRNFDSFCIAWFDNLKIEKGKTRIKVLNTGQPELKLVIHGMTLDGGLIAEELLLPIQEADVSIKSP